MDRVKFVQKSLDKREFVVAAYSDEDGEDTSWKAALSLQLDNLENLVLLRKI